MAIVLHDSNECVVNDVLSFYCEGQCAAPLGFHCCIMSIGSRMSHLGTVRLTVNRRVLPTNKLLSRYGKGENFVLDETTGCQQIFLENL